MKKKLLFISWALFVLFMFFGFPTIAITLKSNALGIIWLISFSFLLVYCTSDAGGYSNGDW